MCVQLPFCCTSHSDCKCSNCCGEWKSPPCPKGICQPSCRGLRRVALPELRFIHDVTEEDRRRRRMRALCFGIVVAAMLSFGATNGARCDDFGCNYNLCD